MGYLPVVLLAITIFNLLCTLYIKKTPVTNIKDIYKLERLIQKHIASDSLKHKRQKYINEITEKNPNIMMRIIDNIIKLIKNKYHEIGFIQYIVATLCLVAIGYFLGVKLLNNFGIAVVLMLVGVALPYIALQYIVNRIYKERDEKLLIVMSNLASSYMQNETFEEAIEDIILTIPEPLNKDFTEYLYEVKYYRPETKITALNKLADRIDNFYFYELINMIIQADYGESDLKYTIKTIPIDYQAYLDKNNEYQRIVEQYNVNFVIRIILLPCIIGFIKILNQDYYVILTENIIGKIALFFVVIVYIIAAVLFRKYNKEIKLEL